MFIFKIEGNPGICNHSNESGGHYARWNNQRKTNPAWYHLYVESKTEVEHIGTEREKWLPGAGGGREVGKRDHNSSYQGHLGGSVGEVSGST